MERNAPRSAGERAVELSKRAPAGNRRSATARWTLDIQPAQLAFPTRAAAAELNAQMSPFACALGYDGTVLVVVCAVVDRRHLRAHYVEEGLPRRIATRHRGHVSDRIPWEGCGTHADGAHRRRASELVDTREDVERTQEHRLLC